MRFKVTIAILLVFALFSTCKKDEAKKDEEAQQKSKITGKIKFPIGSNLNPSGCSVNSFIIEQTLNDENYSVDIISNDFNIQFLTSSDGKELMLGYTYPSQTDFTIDSKSTLLALVMKLPSVNSLSTSGKLNFINKIKASPGYTDAINAIENHIIAAQDIFDTTDVNMQQKIAGVFDYAASHRQGFGYDGQVYINKSGKSLTFGNPGVSIAQVIGIYQGSNRIAKLELDRYQTFVTSITEIPSAFNNPPSPIEVKYDFQNDGIYQIKVRSGGFNLPNNDLESNEAIKTNAWNLVSDNLSVFIPIKLSKRCPEAVNDAIESGVEIFKNTMKASLTTKELMGVVYNLTKKVVQSIIINTCINGNLQEVSYLNKILKYVKWLDFVGKIGTQINNSIFLTDYFVATKSSLDTTITIGTVVPVLNTGNVTSVTQNSAVSGGDIVNDGGSPITARGVCWSTSANPTIANSKTNDGSGNGSFVSNINGLDINTTYFLKAYATNIIGTAYGNEISFTTNGALSLNNTLWEGTYVTINGTYPAYLKLIVGTDLTCSAGWSNGPGNYTDNTFTGTINSSGTVITWNSREWLFDGPWSVSGNSMTGATRWSFPPNTLLTFNLTKQ
jgi:hypothetical protein